MLVGVRCAHTDFNIAAFGELDRVPGQIQQDLLHRIWSDHRIRRCVGMRQQKPALRLPERRTAQFDPISAAG